MSKINQSRPVIIHATSDWDMDIWTSDVYKRHIKDFYQIQKEIRSIREKCYSATVSRWYWLQLRGACKVKLHLGVVDIYANPDNYRMYDNMFNKYNDWLSWEDTKIGVENPTYGEAYLEEIKSKKDWEKFCYELVDFNRPLPQPLLPQETGDKELNAFVEDVTNNF